MQKKILDAFLFRHAAKDFDAARIIPEPVFATILQAGRLSPSSFGFEPWRFLVVQDAALRAKLHAFTWGGQKQIPNCSHLVVYLARKGMDTRADSDYVRDFVDRVQALPADVQKMKLERYEAFQKDDFNLWGDERALFDWACKQVYIALGNMMTVAALLGVDSCPMEGFQQQRIDEVLASDFGIDQSQYGVACMAAFGYRVADPRPKTRQALHDVVQWF
ncbi:NAD(P)H-dependent oxidoreductase [Nitratidesulfovibrio vulgaris]|uniref:Nitroreductase family protein n=1 Tax=Nitratidesulfovibrio vulgaris (strain ATCC 29579 / DSM 644 / CCUG 34227 / NCIMB 8303 / VKM B-1760 / Hildenborough) TaxID=882 RepID=Q726H2_NITV2|nr:NAD(P)H-dependent oxidoreductase [Nitratidesulfovibrio vulgaris]AAS97606.1 nitroreductase family protein [Nitratidesulfovibrio vulgaris str. Hildenborough]ADP88037.1 nitroreductase [Nitratidesulfovibrio vulgaris RCH1]